MAKNIRQPGQLNISDVMESTKRQTMYAMNCVKVGIINKFSPETQRAEVQIAYKQIKDVLEDGTKVYEEYPLLMDVPVVVLFGGVDILTLPIQVGDNCLVFFNDEDIDQWATNGNGFPTTLQILHDISNAIAIVGIRPLSNVITNYLANGIRLSHGGGNSQIDLKDNLIESIAELFLHNGDMRVTRDVTVGRDLEVKRNFIIGGDTYGDGSDNLNLRANLNQIPGYEIHDGRRVSGIFDVVEVVDGIVVGGS